MAATVAASKAYDLGTGSNSTGPAREDLEDIVYDISPMDCWFLNNAGRGTAKSTTHEWLIDSLTAAAANAQIEGNAFSSDTRALPSRLKNYCQISSKSFEVTGTAQAVDNAGMSTLMSYHAARAAKELKRDMEVNLLGNYPASAGTSVSARVSAGVPNWLYTSNHIKLTGQTTNTTTAPVSGFATATMVATSSTAFLSTDLNSMLAQAWSCGGEVDTILTSSSVYNTISAFTSIATRFRDVGSKQQAQIIGAADIYVSAYGSHNIRISRYSPATYVFALDMSTWKVAYLRPFSTIPIAQVGDAVRSSILAEYCLVATAPLGNAKATGAV